MKVENRMPICEYYQAALIKGSFEYYMLCEKRESMDEDRLEQMQCLHKAAQIIGSKSENELPCIQTLEKLRNQIIIKMQILTAYTDRLQIYEYVLNRMEERFKPQTPVDESRFVQQLVHYIFSSKDNMVINENIKDSIGQLPVRMTKKHYLELLRDSISLYKGSDKESLDSYLYMLRTSAMIYEPEQIDLYFIEFKDTMEILKKADYSNLSNTEYDRLVSTLNNMAEKLIDITDYYVSLQETVNSFYTVLLARQTHSGRQTILMPESEESACFRILENVRMQFLSDQKEDYLGKAEENFALLEGVQEEVTERLYEIGRQTEKNGKNTEEEILNLEKMEKLMSTSIFVDLSDKEKAGIVDEEYIETTWNHLASDLSELFGQNQKMVNRAVMAATLSKMPVFFNRMEEVKEYIENSLMQCGDLSEKNVSMRILMDIMDKIKQG